MYRRTIPDSLIPPQQVLIVDRERPSCDVISKVLQKYLGCDPYKAYSVPDALSYLKARDFGLMICDPAFPGSKGIDFVAEAMKLNESLKVLIVTGETSDKDIRQLRRSGIEQVLYKPFKISSLLERVTNVIVEERTLINT